MTSPLPERIRQAISENHVAIEQTAYARGMVSGTISRDIYNAGLVQMRHIHRALEQAVEASSLPQPFRLPPRSPAIDTDLRALGHTELNVPPYPTIVPLLERIESTSQHHPLALLGTIYVLEGSRMGSMMLARTLTRALEVEAKPGQGLDYHIDGIATRPADWKAFKEQLAAWPCTTEDESAILDMATETMKTMLALYQAISSDETSVRSIHPHTEAVLVS